MPHSIGIAVAGSARHGGTEIDGLVGLTVDGLGADCSVCEGSGEGMVMVGRRRRAGMVAVDRMMAGWYFGRSGECHRVDIAHDVAMGSMSSTRRGIGGIELTLATVVIGVGIVTAVDFGWGREGGEWMTTLASVSRVPTALHFRGHEITHLMMMVVVVMMIQVKVLGTVRTDGGATTLTPIVVGMGVVMTAVDFGWSSERHHIVGGGGGSTTVTSIVVRVGVVRGVCLGRGRKIHLLDRG